MHGIVVRGHDEAAQQGAEIGEIGFIEGQRVLGEYHIAVDRIGGRRHPGAIAPDVFLFFFLAFFLLLLLVVFLVLGRGKGRGGRDC